jgi:hypothetical protein
VVVVSVPLLAAAGAVLASQGGAGDSAVPAGWLTTLASTAFMLMALSEWRSGLERRAPWLERVLAVLALSYLARTLTSVGIGPSEGVVGLGLAAGLLALHGSWVDLKVALSAQSQDLLALTVDVHELAAKERSAQADHEERLHEVRNVLAGLHGATATLRKYEDRLDPGREAAPRGRGHRRAASACRT